MAWKDVSLLFTASSAWEPLGPVQLLSLPTGVPFVRCVAVVGPRDGPTFLPQNVVEGREELSHVHGKTQEAPGPGSLGR